jgi:hypothetical protein
MLLTELSSAFVETDVITKKVLITPDIAKLMLKQNYCNRTLRKQVVQIYADAIKEGKWHPDTTETIKVAVNNRILDGQHRLEAIVLSNIPTLMYVSFNLPVDAVTNIDTGAKRSSKDIFDLYGISNSQQLTAVLREYLLYTVAPDSINHLNNNKDKVTTALMLETYNANIALWNENINNINRYARKIQLDFSISGAWFLLAKDISTTDAHTFFTSLADGTNFTCDKDPILKLREHLTNIKLRKETFNNSLNFALFVKAWNYFRKKQTISNLRYSTREAYPKMI